MLIPSHPQDDDDDQEGDGEELDDVFPSNPQDNQYEDLGEASGLVISPDSGLSLCPPPHPPGPAKRKRGREGKRVRFRFSLGVRWLIKQQKIISQQ